MRGIIFKLSGIAVTKKAIAYKSSGFGKSIFDEKKAELISRRFAIPPGRADAFALLMEVRA